MFRPKASDCPDAKIKKRGDRQGRDGILDYPENKRESTEAVRWWCGDETFQHDIGLMATSTALRMSGVIFPKRANGGSPSHGNSSCDTLPRAHHRNNETHLAGAAARQRETRFTEQDCRLFRLRGCTKVVNTECTAVRTRQVGV